MSQLFIISGYGVPKNIFHDENYNFYLKMAFNKIYDLTDKTDQQVIIFCGGNTDLYKPYKRTEAEEMKKFFIKLIKIKTIIKKLTNNWSLEVENKSLSTLENLLNTKKLISKYKVNKLTIICEQTRKKRISLIAKHIFTDKKVTVLPIDFDLSANRYLPKEFLDKKEKAEIKHSLWALKSPHNLKKHHSIFVDKIKYLRKAGPNLQVEELKKWWEKKLTLVKD